MTIIPENVKTINEIVKIKKAHCKMYIENGFALLPLKPGGKSPFFELLPEVNGYKKWKPFQQRKANWIEVENWIDNYPKINIGIITGLVSNLVVLDIDHYFDKQGKPLIQFDENLKTPEVITSRAKHLYFYSDKKIKSGKIEAPNGELIGEISGESSYVVAPPSIHSTGHQYSWSEDNSCTKNNFVNYKNIREIKDKSKNIIRLTKVTKNKSINNQKNKYKLNKNTNKKTKNHNYIDSNYNYNKWWQKLQRDFQVAKELMDLAGVEVQELGKSFNCPFHEDDHPSASLFILDKEDLQEGKNRFIAFSDFHQKGRPEWFEHSENENKYMSKNGSKQHWFNLGEVFFAIETEKELQKLPKGVGVVWWLRALDKLDYINNLPTLTAKKLPVGKTLRFSRDGMEYAVRKNSVKKVYDYFKYLLQLKTIYNPHQKGTAFSHRFAANWCDVSINTAGKAITYLLQAKFIKIIKENPGNKANIFDLERK